MEISGEVDVSGQTGLSRLANQSHQCRALGYPPSTPNQDDKPRILASRKGQEVVAITRHEHPMVSPGAVKYFCICRRWREDVDDAKYVMSFTMECASDFSRYIVIEKKSHGQSASAIWRATRDSISSWLSS